MSRKWDGPVWPHVAAVLVGVVVVGLVVAVYIRRML
jgi:hypothetical protein